jgi:hypothetical protein
MQPEDSFAKFLKIAALSIAGFIGLAGLIVLLFYVVGKYVLGYMGSYAWFDYLLIILLLGIPSFVFLIGYPVFFMRTRMHRFALVRGISYLLFSVGILSCIGFFSWDIYELFKMKDSVFAYKLHTVSSYHSYSELFIGSNVACFFLVGLLQAFSNPKEKSWMEK